jgi:hypothetical protein
MSITLTAEQFAMLDAKTKEKVMAVLSPVAAKKKGPKKLADMTPEELAKHKEAITVRAAARAAARSTASTAAKDAPSTPEPTPLTKVPDAPAKVKRVNTNKVKPVPMASLDVEMRSPSPPKDKSE